MTQEKLIEILRLIVVCPAKGRLLCGQKNIILLRFGQRFIGENKPTLPMWLEKFLASGLDLETELRKLVKLEFGEKFNIHRQKITGSKISYKFMLTKTKKKLVS